MRKERPREVMIFHRFIAEIYTTKSDLREACLEYTFTSGEILQL